MKKKIILGIFLFILTMQCLSVTALAVDTPKNLRAKQNIPLSASRITLEWNSEILGIGNIAGFKVYDNNSYKEIKNISKKSAKSGLTGKYETTFLASVGVHTYTVKAYDNNNNLSPASNEVIVKILNAPRIVKCKSIDKKINIEWTKPAGVNVKHYKLIRNDEEHATIDGKYTSFVDKDVTVGKTYNYSVVAVDKNDYYSVRGNITPATVINSTREIGALTGTAWLENKTYVALEWEKAKKGTPTYSVYKLNKTLDWDLLATTKDAGYNDFDVEKGKTYSYKIKGYDNNENKIYESNKETVTVKKSLKREATGITNQLIGKIPMIQLTSPITGVKLKNTGFQSDKKTGIKKTTSSANKKPQAIRGIINRATSTTNKYFTGFQSNKKTGIKNTLRNTGNNYLQKSNSLWGKLTSRF